MGQAASPGYKDLKGGRLEEVVVTAQKQAERLQDVPVPVTPIDAVALTGSNKLRIEDYYTKVPGLALALRGNGNEPVIAIRGVTTGGDTNPTVGIVVDDVSYGASAITGPNVITAADIDPGDLAQIEVLRGPQGTLYGASSIGGLLKFVTVDPSTEKFSGRVQLGSTTVRHGDDLGYSARAFLNMPLSDTFAMRVSGFTLEDPGYIDNVETGQQDVNKRESEGGRLSVLWRPSDSFSMKLNALIQDSERTGTLDVDRALGADSFRQSLLRGTGVYSRKTESYSATLVGRLGSVELTSATGYSTDETFDDLDTTAAWGSLPMDFFGVDRAVTRTHNTVEKFSEELRASVSLGDRVNWLVGAFYTDEKTVVVADNRAADASGEPNGLLFGNVYDPGEFEERAAFTNVTVDITDRWDVQVGGRYSASEQAATLIFTGAFANLIFGEDPHFAERVESRNSAVTYLLTPRFRISPDMMVYARFASGFRPGGPNPGCGVPGLPCEFEADKTQNYEIGMKGAVLENTVSFDASLYYIDWKNIQISGIELPDSGGFFYTGNVSRARSEGVELSVDLQPNPEWTLSAWVAWNDATLRESLPATSTLVGGPGARLPYSSRLSGNVSLDRKFELSSAASLSIGGSLSYVGDREGNFQPSGVERENFPSYSQLDLQSQLAYRDWNVGLFVNNATDRRGILRGGADAIFVPSYVTYIQPRTIGITFSKSY